MKYVDFKDYIDALVNEYKEDWDKDEYDIYEYAHHAADNSEHVIYTYKAWKLVMMIRECQYDLFMQSEEDMENRCYEINDLDNAMTAAAYMIIVNAITDTYNTEELAA